MLERTRESMMSWSRVALVCAGCVVLAGCPPTPPDEDEPDPVTPMPDKDQGNEPAQDMGNGPADMGQEPIDQGSAPVDMTEPVEDAGGEELDLGGELNYPMMISTLGASFSGTLAPGQTITIDLRAKKNDRVKILFKKANGSDWNPYVSIGVVGASDPLVYGNPRGNDDATIPFRSAELDEGWEFWNGGDYVLTLRNLTNSTPGPFTFLLECRGGPCSIDPNDLDGDGIPNAQDNCEELPNPEQEDTDNDGTGDLCDPDSGVDPFQGLMGQELIDAIRDNHQHNQISYDDARDHLFETVDQDGGEVECVYTGERVMTLVKPPAQEMNTEHTWPQSKGAGTLPAQSDLHHLFPTIPSVNTRRSNHPFCEINPQESGDDASWEGGGSTYGSDDGRTCFEPRDSHKGNVARAMFYFSVIYNYRIDSTQEAYFRAWHLADPVDEAERVRNQRIANIQISRNPFIDYPMLVERVSDF